MSRNNNSNSDQAVIGDGPVTSGHESDQTEMFHI